MSEPVLLKSPRTSGVFAELNVKREPRLVALQSDGAQLRIWASSGDDYCPLHEAMGLGRLQPAEDDVGLAAPGGGPCGASGPALTLWAMKQRVSLISLGVADLHRSRRFYEALGWQIGA